MLLCNFVHIDKHENLLQIDAMIFMGMVYRVSHSGGNPPPPPLILQFFLTPPPIKTNAPHLKIKSPHLKNNPPPPIETWSTFPWNDL